MLLIAGLLAPVTAVADERDACVRGTRWRGHTVDLDLKGVPLSDVFRLLSDVGRINVVVGDDVKGAVTLRLTKVPWDQAMCTIARVKQLRVSVDGNVYLITAAPR